MAKRKARTRDPFAPKKELPDALKRHMWPKGVSGNPCPNARKGKQLITRIRELMREAARDEHGRLNTNFELVAREYVTQMRHGSFAHTKEFIDRESGKVASRIADGDGNTIKMFVGMPVDGDGAP